METQKIVDMLVEERNRITRAILILNGPNDAELLDAGHPENAKVRLGRIFKGLGLHGMERQMSAPVKRFSAATRAKMSAAQKARYAKLKKAA